MLIPNSPRSLLPMVLFALTCTLGAACESGTNSETSTPVLSGPPQTSFPMPPLSVSSEMGWITADNKRERVADYRGRVLVLDFYATWCAPCRHSIPELKALQEKYSHDGIQVVGLNVGGPDDRVKVAAFASELAISYPLGFPDKAMTDLFLSDDQTIPQTFVFGRNGQLAQRIIGYDSSKSLELRKTVEAAVAQPKEQTANGAN